jgi:hypothetical protein
LIFNAPCGSTGFFTLSVHFFHLFVTCQCSEAFEEKGLLIAQDGSSGGMILMDAPLVRGSYRIGYF